LQNLATNALRYNCEAGIVRFLLQARDGRAVLTVANTGPGMPQGEREKVFQRFHRVDPARSRRRESDWDWRYREKSLVPTEAIGAAR